MPRYMIQVRATAMSEAGDFPDDPTLVPRMMAFHDEMAARFPREKFNNRHVMALTRFIRANSERLGLGGAFRKGVEFVYGGAVKDKQAFQE